MPLPTTYSTGTVTVTEGETTVTFSGALLGTAGAPNLQAGDHLALPSQPLVPQQRLASVDYGAGTAELWVGWPGESASGVAYEVRLVDELTRSTAQTRLYLELLGQLQALGIQPDAVGTLAGRDTYDLRPPPFIYLSIDAPWTLYAKQSATDGDWDAGQQVVGPQGPAGSGMMVAVTNEATAIATGAAKVTFRAPNALTLTGIRASLTTASSSGPVQVDVNVDGVSILSTKITIDQGEKTSVTAATPPVLSDTTIPDDAEITIDIDAAGTGATGLKVTLIGTQA